jgi:6-phosphogluconolactonase
MKQIRRWHNYPDRESLKHDVIKEITDHAQRSILTHGCFRIVLAGGSTPKAVYQGLRNIKTEWSAWHIYFGDERCLPIGEEERNDSMALHCWLSHVSIPSEQVYSIPAELGAIEGAKAYADTLKGINSFDLVLLGLGEDGHTASLFPGHHRGEEVGAPDVLAVHHAPKPPAERISLSANRLSRAKQVMFLVTGEGKRGAIIKWQDEKMIPAASVCPKQGVDIYTDLVVKEQPKDLSR